MHEQHPSHQLVEVDISRPDAGGVMEAAFGIDRACWQRFNAHANATPTAMPTAAFSAFFAEDVAFAKWMEENAETVQQLARTRQGQAQLAVIEHEVQLKALLTKRKRSRRAGRGLRSAHRARQGAVRPLSDSTGEGRRAWR